MSSPKSSTLTTEQSSSPQPLVSVLIPVYNNAAFLADTLAAVFAQSYQNLEILISDDASSDRTAEVMRAIQDERVKTWFQKDNLGAEANWNFLLERAHGRYVKLLCGDDIIAADCIAQQVAVLEQDIDHQIALVTSQKCIIDAKGKVLLTRQVFKQPRQLSGVKAMQATVSSGTNILGEPGSGLFRRDLVDNKKLRYCARHPYVIDLDFWSQLLQHGDIYILPDVHFSFRISKTSWSSKLLFKQWHQYSAFICELKQSGRYPLSEMSLWLGRSKALLGAWVRLMFFSFLTR